MSTRERSWPLPVALIALSAIPLTAGTLRLIQLAGGPAVIPADHRFASFPLPLVVHIVGATTYALLGILQFLPRFRRRHPAWHRRAGRVLAVAGLLVAISAIWMTLFYEAQPGTGDLLYVLRLVFASAMAACVVLGVAAVRRRDIQAHRAWMIRAYAIGLAAGTQVFTEGIGGTIFGTGVLAADRAPAGRSIWPSPSRPSAAPPVTAPHSPQVLSKLEHSHQHLPHDIRDPRRRPPRRPLVGLARRPRRDPRGRRHHHHHRLGRRPSAAPRRTRPPARHRRRNHRAPHRRCAGPQAASRCLSARCTPNASHSVPRRRRRRLDLEVPPARVGQRVAHRPPRRPRRLPQPVLGDSASHDHRHRHPRPRRHGPTHRRLHAIRLRTGSLSLYPTGIRARARVARGRRRTRAGSSRRTRIGSRCGSPSALREDQG